jgi:hypothetical protein
MNLTENHGQTELVFTKYGNLPRELLTYRHEWQPSDNALFFVEEYALQTTGEVVKRSRHGYLFRAPEAGVTMGAING